MSRERHQSPCARLPEIIRRPDLQSRRQRGLCALVACLGWLLWLYLFLPLSTLVAWIAGIQRFDAYVIESREHSWSSLTVYALTIALAGCALLLWAFYNYRRFRHVDRRSPATAVTTEKLALSFGIAQHSVDILQDDRSLTLEHDARGNIVGIVPRTQSAASLGVPAS
ncbi:poly-beta-1,6-N-acetyl-D-glucosamine biosynthesis protein PgaD [Salinicola avicenniae]|uniref:poly-beta-1,6-N-acetyl-D-glucosamine biosynthesis protein PgaD n=1 Tax=Salinicola avicenniae TaxID=2916836 RepID=UPI002074174D|nr:MULTISPECIES: poly-beta-1,6-N-acetyl-D-glucosamine biosynthesis protein PgaD [unclassified Salinicola]